MAGQFAHICLVNKVCEPQGLDAVRNLMPSVRSALENYTPFCRLGAVSPDCPSVVGSTDATGWNGVMHYVRPADFVRYGIAKLLEMPFNKAETRACIAWLFGYAAHLVADYTIHPIVMALVGPYSIKKNRAGHRRCELDQDSHIFQALTGSEIIETDFLQFTGLAECGVKGNTRKLNPAIAELWAYCLRQYPRPETKKFVRLPNRSLDPECWFATYINLMKNVATKKGGIVKFMGMAYQRSSQADLRYIEKLPVPNSSKRISYDDLFETTRKNIIETWSQMAEALQQETATPFLLANASLDDGKDESGNYIYWS
jgi:hypothetical protein